MHNHELIEEMKRVLDDDSLDNEIKAAILRTDIQEAAHMPEGDNETLPAMTLEELDAFLNSEDEVLKEDRGETPVAEQLSDV